MWMEILNNYAEINPLKRGQMLENVVRRRRKLEEIKSFNLSRA